MYNVLLKVSLHREVQVNDFIRIRPPEENEWTNRSEIHSIRICNMDLSHLMPIPHCANVQHPHTNGPIWSLDIDDEHPSFDAARGTISAGDYAQIVIRLFILSTLRITGGGDIIFNSRHHSGGVMTISPNIVSFSNGSVCSNIFDEETSVEVVNLFINLMLVANSSERLYQALMLTFRSLEDPSDRVAIILASAAFENIFEPSYRNKAIKKGISRCVADFLGESQNDRDEIYRSCLLCYNDRCVRTHGRDARSPGLPGNLRTRWYTEALVRIITRISDHDMRSHFANDCSIQSFMRSRRSNFRN